MTFVTPITGLLVGVIVVPLLLLLYFLRLRRVPLRVPSTMLWERAVEDLHANTPFQRLRPSTLLLLQLMATVLVALAIMQPQIEGGTPKSGKHVILIDHSGSMTATTQNGKTRLEEAKEKAQELVNQLYGGGLFSSKGGETMVIAFADHAKVIAPFTDSKQQLDNAIESIRPTHGKSNIDESLRLARAYATTIDPEQGGLSASESAQLEVFSDGLISDIQEQALQRGESLQYHMVGSIDDSNIGISTIDAKRTSEASEDVQVFISIINASPTQETVDIELSIDGIPVGVQQVQVPKQDKGLPGSASLVFVPFSMPNAGIVSVKILREDSLAIDNHASLIIAPTKELRVLVSENGPPIIRTILQGMSLAELKEVQTKELQEMIQNGELSSYDVVVLRDLKIETLPRGNYFIFGEPPPITPFETYVEGEAQVMLVTNEQHPVMRFVRYEDIVVMSGYDVVFDDSINVLLEGSNWPAVMAYRGEGVQLVYVAFDPLNSNWPYLRSFPFFVFNGVHFLGHRGSQLTQSTRLVGQTISQSIHEGETVQVVEPDGVSHTVMIDGNRNINWGPIRLTGLHAITSEQTKTIQVAINAPVEESTIASVEQISIGATKVTSSNSSGTSFIQLWPWALGAVLFVLLAEWWVYQKKVSTPLRTSWSQTQLEERGFR